TEVLEEMRALAPGHRLTLQFALEVARQRGDRRAQRAHLDALLELAPRTPRWAIDRAAAMRDLESRNARREDLFAHSDSKDSDLAASLVLGLRRPRWVIDRAASMRDLESLSARREYLFPHSGPRRSDLLTAIAAELRHHGSTLETAARLLRKSIRPRPQSAF